MDKFKNKYRIASTRLQNWDYGANGAYFITICTQNRESFFGEILDGKMALNEIGQWAEKLWLEIPCHFSGIELGNFVIMPNHTHGILIINNVSPVETRLIASQPNTTKMPITTETRLIASLPTNTLPSQPEINGGFSGAKNPMFHENISRIIRWYKGRCSFEMRKINPNFAWQSRFHDHIIRNSKSFENIQNYISNNPINWGKDKFYSKKG